MYATFYIEKDRFLIQRKNSLNLLLIKYLTIKSMHYIYREILQTNTFSFSSTIHMYSFAYYVATES